MLTSRLKTPPPGKCFIAIMTTKNAYHARAEETVAGAFGPLERHSDLYEFSRFSPYYDQEMGGPVWKYFVTFSRLMPMDLLVTLKRAVEEIQNRFAIETDRGLRRTVNLDPGYVTGWNLVLSTVKNNAHRLYLGRGVYGEVTLLFRNHAFEPLPWTYPDYASQPVIDFFMQVRCDYLRQVANWSGRSQDTMQLKGIFLET